MSTWGRHKGGDGRPPCRSSSILDGKFLGAYGSSLIDTLYAPTLTRLDKTFIIHMPSSPLPTSEPRNLTWQQELLTQSWKADRKKAKPKPKKKDPPPAKKVEPVSTGLTWQQELFQQGKRPGATFDHAETARDVETFGAAISQPKQPPAQPPKPQKNKNAPKKNKSTKPPETPSKTSSGTPLAYAAPGFHNSPSAASLPAPRFLSRAKEAPRAPAEDAPASAATCPAQPETVDHLLTQILHATSIQSGPTAAKS